jgi:hypothetical protein
MLSNSAKKCATYEYIFIYTLQWYMTWTVAFFFFPLGKERLYNWYETRYLTKTRILILIPGPHWAVWFTGKDLNHGWTNPGRHVARAAKFYMVAHNVFCFLVWNQRHVTLIPPRILMWLLEVWKIFEFLLYPSLRRYSVRILARISDVLTDTSRNFSQFLQENVVIKLRWGDISYL